MNPLFEIMEIEHIRITYMTCVQPFYEEGEIVPYLLSVENTVHHVAAEKT